MLEILEYEIGQCTFKTKISTDVNFVLKFYSIPPPPPLSSSIPFSELLTVYILFEFKNFSLFGTACTLKIKVSLILNLKNTHYDADIVFV